MLNLQNLERDKRRLDNVDVETFANSGDSFTVNIVANYAPLLWG